MLHKFEDTQGKQPQTRGEVDRQHSMGGLERETLWRALKSSNGWIPGKRTEPLLSWHNKQMRGTRSKKLKVAGENWWSKRKWLTPQRIVN